MFRKIVSSLPFSPALVGHLGFYARRLQKEEVTRRLGLIFTVLAIAVQSFAVFSPPEQALASSASDVIPGGIKSVQQIMDVYDAGAKGNNDFKDLMDYLGITRNELAAMSSNVEYIHSNDQGWISFGRQPHYSAADGELMHAIPRASGGVSIFYSVPLVRFDRVNGHINWYDAYVGHSAKVGDFSIMRKCGNVQIKKNIQKFPKGKMVVATCTAVQGYAYDERQLSLPVKVYLYFGGPPGKGKQFGPLNADKSAPTNPAGGKHGFSFDVPEEYKKAGHATTVWASFQPLPGWQQNLVQFENTASIPGDCTPPEVPIASCSGLIIAKQLDRTRLQLTATGTADNGATISAYVLSIVDNRGNKVYEKTIPSTANTLTSEIIDLKKDGEYIAKVVIKTSVGDKTQDGCSLPLVVSPQEKCTFLGSGTINKDDQDCKPCPYNGNIWIKDADCAPKINEFKEAANLTRNIKDANGTTANATDRIEFTIYTTNAGDLPATAKINENLADVLEYARLIDMGGGQFDKQSQVLSWGDVKLEGHKTDVRKFIVQLFDDIPAKPRAGNNPASFDCVMTNSYGATIEIKVNCPAIKGIETSVTSVPATGPGENILFAALLLMGVTYFYVRSRQMRKEVQLIRKDF